MSRVIKRNIWSWPPYVFKATASGVGVYDYATTTASGFLPTASGVAAVWSNGIDTYFATGSGVYSFPVDNPGNVSYYTEGDAVYLHGSGPYLCVSTVSGVTRYKLSDSSQDQNTVSGAGKCFQLAGGDYYYYTDAQGYSELHAHYEVGGSYTYTMPTYINDIYVTEDTSAYSGSNVLFLATTSGAYVIEERQGDEENNRIKTYLLDT